MARLLADLVRAEGFSATADRISDAIAMQVTVEAPLTLADHESILETLRRNCPSTLNRLRQRLDEERRYVRDVTGT